MLNYLGIIEQRRTIFQDSPHRDKIAEISKQDELTTITLFKGLRRKVLNAENYDDHKLAHLADKLEEIREKAIELELISKSIFVSPDTKIKNNKFIQYLYEAMRLESVEESLVKLNKKIFYIKAINVLIPVLLVVAILVMIIYDTSE